MFSVYNKVLSRGFTVVLRFNDVPQLLRLSSVFMGLYTLVQRAAIVPYSRTFCTLARKTGLRGSRSDCSRAWAISSS
jgi:hypothetical protein